MVVVKMLWSTATYKFYSIYLHRHWSGVISYSCYGDNKTLPFTNMGKKIMNTVCCKYEQWVLLHRMCLLSSCNNLYECSVYCLSLHFVSYLYSSRLRCNCMIKFHCFSRSLHLAHWSYRSAGNWFSNLICLNSLSYLHINSNNINNNNNKNSHRQAQHSTLSHLQQILHFLNCPVKRNSLCQTYFVTLHTLCYGHRWEQNMRYRRVYMQWIMLATAKYMNVKIIILA